jgi:hypothetical protein
VSALISGGAIMDVLRISLEGQGQSQKRLHIRHPDKRTFRQAFDCAVNKITNSYMGKGSVASNRETEPIENKE